MNKRDEVKEALIEAWPHLSYWARLEILWMLRWFLFRNWARRTFPTLAARLLVGGLLGMLAALAMAAAVP